MNTLNHKIDEFLVIGCGRCPLGGTPQCKVLQWTEELVLMRKIVMECGLTEEFKWSQPTYTFEGKNMFIISAFKDYAFISFFNGALLKDPHQILTKTSENSNAGRLLKVTNAKELAQIEPIVKEYILESIKYQKEGIKVPTKAVEDYNWPEELVEKMDNDPYFEKAFRALTPGRQKGYIIHFAGAKQSKTRAERIEKYTTKILEGKGFFD